MDNDIHSHTGRTHAKKNMGTNNVVPLRWRRRMELVITVREFTHEMTVRHLAPDTHIRVIIEESETPTHDRMSPKTWLPQVTPQEQRARLNCLPYEANPSASAELVEIIETSHVNAEPVTV